MFYSRPLVHVDLTTFTPSELKIMVFTGYFLTRDQQGQNLLHNFNGQSLTTYHFLINDQSTSDSYFGLH